MDNFPASYIAVPQPLLVFSGLTSGQTTSVTSKGLTDGGQKITSDIPPLEGERADALLTEFMKHDGQNQQNTNNEPISQPKSKLFRIKAIGRDYYLPRRKETPSHAQSPPTSPVGRGPTSESRSPLSPLCHGSPLFPDGLMTPLWLEKHLDVLPSVFVSFFGLSTDPKNDSLNDNQLKNEINAVKTAIADSQHRTRFAVVIVANESTAHDMTVEERLENIRKAAKLDNKTSFFYLAWHPHTSEIPAFVTSVLGALRSAYTSYYGELSKRARRKKDKGSSPPPSVASTPGIAHRLDSRGWNIRYAFKQAIFAEFTAEMDSASRQFEIALSLLLDAGGVLNARSTISSWSPRWSESRLFADAMALRNVRCLLANGCPAAAVRAQKVHRKRLQALLIREGKSLDSYSWKAWEARWARCISQLVSECGYLAIDSNAKKILEPVLTVGRLVYAQNELATTADERFPPWEHLHHEGYWLKVSAERTKDRKRFAQAIPEEDRMPSDQSPATAIARRGEKYDTYLSQEPHVEYLSAHGPGSELSKQMTNLMLESSDTFSKRTQRHMADYLKLAAAREFVEDEKYEAAMSLLTQLWQSNLWRAAGWYSLVGACAMNLHLCAQSLGNKKIELATRWELMNSVFDSYSSLPYDAITSHEAKSSRISLELTLEIRDDQIVSFLNASVSFPVAKSFVGDACKAEVMLSSQAHDTSPPITPSEITIQFNDLLTPVTILHKISTRTDETTEAQLVEEVDKVLYADLTIRPNAELVLNLDISPQTSGALQASAVVVHLENSAFDLKHIINLNESRNHDSTLKSRIPWQRHLAVKHQEVEILPKPPKVFVAISNVLDHYYTNEYTAFDIELKNEEVESAFVWLELRCVSSEGELMENTLSRADEGASDRDEALNGSLKIEIGRLAAGAEHHERSTSFRAPTSGTDLHFELTTTYYLEDDIENIITKTTHLESKILVAFGAKYSVKAAINPDPWPSVFGLVQKGKPASADAEEATDGIVTKWSLRATVTSKAQTDLIVERSELVILSAELKHQCRVMESSATTFGVISPGENVERNFTIEISKPEAVDIKTVALETVLLLHWRRADGVEGETTTTALEVPSLVLPCNEPRVLANVEEDPSEAEHGVLRLDLILENPSKHFLSFAISLEGSDDFAYSGPRASTIQCLPLSRRAIKYTIFPFERGRFIHVRPKVFDMFYNKSLQIHTTANLRLEQQGVRIWVGKE